MKHDASSIEEIVGYCTKALLAETEEASILMLFFSFFEGFFRSFLNHYLYLSLYCTQLSLEVLRYKSDIKNDQPADFSLKY